ncbi:MAG: DUF4167 domain-containing protein [Pseudomonadota bacterium]
MAMQRKRRRRSGGSNNNNNPNRHFDSNGPDVRIRGSAQQVLEKYQQYARDAQTSGDRIKAEGLFQHAEHYARIVATFERQKEDERREREERDARRAEERAARGEEAVDESESDAVEDQAAETELQTDSEAESLEDAAPKRRNRRSKAEPVEDEAVAETNGHDAVEAVAEEVRADDEKPKRRRRSYTPKSDDDGAHEGVMKTLARGADDAEPTPAMESDA